PGLLSEGRRVISQPKVADTWSYSRTGGTGSGSGFLGVREEGGMLKLNVEYHISHVLDGQAPVNLQILGEVEITGDVWTFLLPFVRKDGGEQYLVVSFEPRSGPALPLAQPSRTTVPPQTGTPPVVASFGPVHEHVLLNAEQKPGYEALDLRTGNFRSFPK